MTPLDHVNCVSCDWSGPASACVKRDGLPVCRDCGAPVESACDPPAMVLGGNEVDPMADTR